MGWCYLLNPLRHFYPLGVLCMLVGGVGWAKPVSINPYNYKNPKVGMALSAAAGPASNLLLAWVSMILYKLCWYSGLGDAVPVLTMFLYYSICCRCRRLTAAALRSCFCRSGSISER